MHDVERAQPELFRLIAEYTYDWETWVDEHGQARWVNPAVERITGFSVEECLGDQHYPLSLVHTLDRAVVERTLLEASEGKSGNDVEFRIVHRAGQSVWVAMSFQPLRSQEGRDLGYRTSVRDIDARKGMEDELHAMRRRAEHALRARSALLANVSHELRSPVHCIAGFAELLSQHALDAEQRRYVDLIEDQCHTMLHQVDDLLGLAALEADGVRLGAAPFDITHVVERIVEAGELRARLKPVELVIDSELAKPYRLGDALRVRQVLRNLLDNALKFTDRGRVVVRLRGDNESVVCEVEDTGPGIPEEQVARMFEPFVQGDGATTRRHGGVGLGLSIAQRLVRAMQGELSVDSKSAGGTTVRVRLPLPCAEAVPVELSAPLVPLPVPARVLVVDDSAPARELLGAMLRRLGAHASPAASGAEAKQLAAQEAIDLVLLDYQMPDADGAETALSLRRILDARGETRGVPIHLLTANVFVRDELAAGSTAFDGIFQKPLAMRDLARLLHSLGKRESVVPAGPAPVASVEPSVEDELLDMSVVDELLATRGRDGEPLLARFAPRVLHDVETTLQRLMAEQGTQSSSAVAEVARTSHALSGNALSIGARGLGLALRAAESAALAGDAPRAQRECARAFRLCGATRDALAARGVS